MDVIAEKAGVSRRTLHRYFSSREHMIKECAETIMSKMLIDVKKVLDTDISAVNQLRQMFEDDVRKGQHYEFCQKFSDHFAEEEIQLAFKEMGELFYGLLDHLKSTGTIDIQLSNEWLSYVWMGMVRSANQALKDGAIAPNKVNELAWNAFSSGVIIQNVTKTK
jgi:AcrR family transcriptional regulator